MMNIQKFAASTGKFVTLRNEVKALGTNLVAVDTTAGIKFDCKDYPNGRLMFIFQNTEASAAKDIKVLKPTNGGYAAASADLVVEDLAAGAVAVAHVETAKYANNDGSIYCLGESANVKVAAVVLGK